MNEKTRIGENFIVATKLISKDTISLKPNTRKYHSECTALSVSLTK